MGISTLSERAMTRAPLIGKSRPGLMYNHEETAARRAILGDTVCRTSTCARRRSRIADHASPDFMRMERFSSAAVESARDACHPTFLEDGYVEEDRRLDNCGFG